MKKLFENLSGKKVLILGFGREGQSTYRLLRQEYPEMQISIADINTVEVETDKNCTLYFGEDYLNNICDFDYIIKSPGIPFGNKLIEAKKKGVEITSQTKIFFDKCLGRIIGVTGTKGKSTTSTIIYQILKKSGLKTFLVGNIENPSLEVLSEDNKEDIVFVYELSSQQLADLDKSPHISIITNIGIDHLDWHGSVEEYINAKRNIVKYQNKDGLAVLNGDDEIAKNFSNITKAEIIFFGLENKNYGGCLDDGKLKIRLLDKLELIIDPKKIILRGKHNWLNILAASIVAKKLGIDNQTITDVIYSFTGLEHRLEFVRKINGINFFNDSISTNPTAFLAAINSFVEPLTVITGGYDRGLDYSDLGKSISEKENVKNIILIGDTGKKIGKEIKNKNIVSLGHTTMIRIIEVANKITPVGGVVLLSPASASFDMFKNYKDRGEQFKKAVNSLA